MKTMNNNNIKIAIVCVSRGIVFSRLMESVLKNIKGFNYEIFMQHGISLPNCYNFAMEEVMKSDCTHVWFVEEDHVFPDDTLKRLLELDTEVATTAYVDRRTGENIATHQPNGDLFFTGMGCMLVKISVFNKLEAPYFRTCFFELQRDSQGNRIMIPRTNLKNTSYGGQDVYFWAEVIKHGITHELLKNAFVGHMIMLEKGKETDNNGAHMIRTLYLPKDDSGNEIEINIKK